MFLVDGYFVTARPDNVEQVEMISHFISKPDVNYTLIFWYQLKNGIASSITGQANITMYLQFHDETNYISNFPIGLYEPWMKVQFLLYSKSQPYQVNEGRDIL